MTSTVLKFKLFTGSSYRRAVYLALFICGGAFADNPTDCTALDSTATTEQQDYCAIHIEATTAVISGNEESNFTGNVKLRHQGQQVEADELSYNPKSEQLEAHGGVYFKTTGADIEADSAVVSTNAEKQSATFSNAKFRIEQSTPPASGRAAKIILDEQQQRLSSVRYTTCDPQDPEWELRAAQIDIDSNSGQGVADSVTLRIKNIPVLYLPKLPFPATNQRTSGFLPPLFDSSASKGSEVRLPWYWNLDPSVDATISPSIMSDRGLGVGLELRYLTAGIDDNDLARSQLSGFWLPDDKTTHSQRYHASWQHRQRWGSSADQWVAVFSDINNVGDADYFFDFDNNQQPRQTHLSSNANVSLLQRNRRWQQSLNVKASRHKELAAESQQTLPGIRYEIGGTAHNGVSWSVSPEWAELKSKADALHFQRSVITAQASWTQQNQLINSRFNGGYRYHAEKNLQQNTSADIHLPFASLTLASGIEQSLNGAFQHRLELTTAYHYAEHQNQSAFSQLDSSARPGLWDDLWVNNRFAGNDRFSDSNDLSWGLSNIFADARGIEVARIDVGQRLAISDSKLLSNNNQQWVSRAQARLSKRLSVFGEGLYDAESGKWSQATVDLRYQPSEELSAYGRWSRPSESSEQFTLASEYENASINIAAQWTRDIENHRSLGGQVAVAYKACCWSLGLSMRRNTSADPAENAQMTTSWGLQFELRGLGGISQSSTRESYSVRRWLY